MTEFTWKAEEQKLTKENFYINGWKAYTEEKLTREEKIAALDKYFDGIATYVLNLKEDYEKAIKLGIIKCTKDSDGI